MVKYIEFTGLYFCPGCKNELPRDSFGVDKHSSTGLRFRCKTCISTRDELRRPRTHLKFSRKEYDSMASSGLKHCSKCNFVKSLNAFHKDKSEKQGYKSWCKMCSNDAVGVYNLEHTNKRAIILKELLDEQGGLCRGCGSVAKVWHIDHDHSCCGPKSYCRNCIRGVLCSNCNMALGLLKDSPDTLRNLANYIEDWHSRSGELEYVIGSNLGREKIPPMQPFPEVEPEE